MSVFVVTEETGEYSQTNWCVKAAFATHEAAEAYVAGMESLPGIAGEYAPGREARYAIEEIDVWDSAPERVMRFHIFEYVRPGSESDPRVRPPYRTEEFYPVGYTDDLVSTNEWADDPRSAGWRTVHVTAATEEACIAEYRRLLAEPQP